MPRPTACSNEQTHNFTTVFLPIAFIELTYALDRYAGVTRGPPSTFFLSPLGSDDVTDWDPGSVVEPTPPLVVAREVKKVLA